MVRLTHGVIPFGVRILTGEDGIFNTIGSIGIDYTLGLLLMERGNGAVVLPAVVGKR